MGIWYHCFRPRERLTIRAEGVVEENCSSYVSQCTQTVLLVFFFFFHQDPQPVGCGWSPSERVFSLGLLPYMPVSSRNNITCCSSCLLCCCDNTPGISNWSKGGFILIDSFSKQFLLIVRGTGVEAAGNTASSVRK